MKIIGDQRLTGVVRNTSRTSSSPARKVSNQGTDRVNLSDSKEEIGKLKTMMQQIPDNSIEKLPHIRQLIDNSTYHAEARDVAEKILDHWKVFNGR